MLELKGDLRKPPSPFKFNAGWLKDSSFTDLVNAHWTHLDVSNGNRATVRFMENFKRIKKATITWVHEKKVRDEDELSNIEAWINSKTEGEGPGFFFEGDKEDLIWFEKRRRVVLAKERKLGG